VGPLATAAQTSGVIDVPHRRERPGPNRDGRVVVHIPTGVAGAPAGNAGDLVRSAWRPGVTVVVADMTTVRNWDEPGLVCLLRAHSDLARRQAELRLVVWSAGLYAALQTADISGQLTVYANVDAALREP
jgi:STAS domain